jgi:hypothetical protein
LATAPWIGCQAPEAPGADQVKTLESENLELRQLLETAQRGHVQAVALLTEVKRKLDEMTGREAEVRNRQAELESGTWETSTDLREQILSDLEALNNDLKDSQRKLRQAVAIAPETTKGEETSAELTDRLAEKERIILLLREKMANLEEEAVLRAETERSQEKVRIAREETERARAESERARTESERVRVERERERARAESVISRERIQPRYEPTPRPRERAPVLSEIGACYIFKGDPGEIEEALHRREVLRHDRTYHVSHRASTAQEPPRIFRELSPERSDISLGRNLRNWEILSVHKHHERSLFQVVRDGDETILRITDPSGFWRLNRFLIVEVR